MTKRQTTLNKRLHKILKSNTDTTKGRRWTQVLRKGIQFLLN